MRIHDVGWWVPSTQAIIYLFQKNQSFRDGKRKSKEFHPTFRRRFNTQRANKLFVCKSLYVKCTISFLFERF